MTCYQFVVDEDHHPGSHPSLALATVCVDPTRLVVASAGFWDVDEVSRVRPLFESNFSVSLLYVRSVSIPDVVELGCFFSFDDDWCGSCQNALSFTGRSVICFGDQYVHEPLHPDVLESVVFIPESVYPNWCTV